ncbi:slipin family protein [Bacilliculturomica massiliensis]|uniref:slipin family protein n=1 Tax=Bacilliculturomica massiliensis TaxID=1917867 RepID=UPI0010315BEF|nr:slipin family protein [Bacilliculturomica massiliensis]
MTTITIKENQRGFLFVNGTFERMLMPGKHRFFRSGCQVKVKLASGRFLDEEYDIGVFRKDENFSREIAQVDVADQTIALHYIDGKFDGHLTPGAYAFWSVFERHEFREISTGEPEVSADVPRFIFDWLPKSLYQAVRVESYERALLYFDQKLQRVLSEGTYYFWNNGTKIDARFVDIRLTQLDLTGQEIMTLDKVSLRINFVCYYKITDPVKVCTEIRDLDRQIHILTQMALREYVGRYRLDEILENKEQISDFVYRKMKQKEGEYYVSFSEAGVKDIILPGEIRDIMNTVLLAEKRAQANVITRREEVASTRSLLNTAKLMDENQTLYKLKELEYLEKICENVGTITVGGGSDLLSQLTAVLQGA